MDFEGLLRDCCGTFFSFHHSLTTVDLRDTSVDPWTYVLESVASDRFVDVSKEKEVRKEISFVLEASFLLFHSRFHF